MRKERTCARSPVRGQLVIRLVYGKEGDAHLILSTFSAVSPLYVHYHNIHTLSPAHPYTLRF